MEKHYQKFLTVYFLLIFSTICNGKIPKEYQIDKSKWQNPSDHYTKVTADDLEVVEIDEINICAKDDGNCDSNLNEWRQNEWLFAWGTIVVTALMAFIILFSCLFFLCKKKQSIISQNMAFEEPDFKETKQNIVKNVPLNETKEIDEHIGQNILGKIYEPENTKTLEEVSASENEERIDEKINSEPKIEFDNEFLLFGPIESESEAEGIKSKFETSLTEEELMTSSDFIYDNTLKNETASINNTNIEEEENNGNNLLHKNDEITPIFTNPSNIDSYRTSTDEDDDFYVIGNKKE
uniref:Uncharacterized protein n=1 Tax=Panagrolaimus davidi TaxID=227884 RepID=A0A914PSG4_9BILA